MMMMMMGNDDNDDDDDDAPLPKDLQSPTGEQDSQLKSDNPNNL